MRRRLLQLWRVLAAPLRILFRLAVWLAGGLAEWLADLAALFRNTEDALDRPLGDTMEKFAQDPNAALHHIAKLRVHLMRSLLALGLAVGVAFFYTGSLLAFIAAPIGGLQNLQAIQVTEPIAVAMRVPLLAGFAAALPYLLLETIMFFGIAFPLRTRVAMVFSLPVVLFFFLAGMAFAYYVMLGPALQFLLHLFDIPTNPTAINYIGFITGLMFWVGIAFEFPLVIYLLVALGLVKTETLLANSRYIVAGLAVLAAAITPTPDPFNMFLVWGPLVGLYFLGVGLAFLAQKTRRAR